MRSAMLKGPCRALNDCSLVRIIVMGLNSTSGRDSLRVLSLLGALFSLSASSRAGGGHLRGSFNVTVARRFRDRIRSVYGLKGTLIRRNVRRNMRGGGLSLTGVVVGSGRSLSGVRGCANFSTSGLGRVTTSVKAGLAT